ncbi:hypothetical protein BFP70_03780 [Thioclava sp. SK-1]|uniref:DUF1190 domain-containing protein n=1 Tax=Thioclava sp. SK-1 TaxID=1889770 RepID=UPI000826B221|nr:DUF1190 domain-containing protein [Thioclava sp. SK-1]OCX66951.1 hypothetical protein BFP70_03780 [Thioclava sp. SK-1]
MRKRSRTVALAIVGATSFALAGCRDEQVDAEAFPDLQSCETEAANGGLFTAEACRTAFAEAEQLHVESAPRYDSLQVCEEEHGAGACGSESQATQGGGSGSIFMPLLAGYLIGNMLGGNRGMSAAQPLYRTPDGKFTNATGASTYSTNKGRAKLGSSMFAKPPTTMGKPPMTKASVASRGGFGSAGTARSSFGG